MKMSNEMLERVRKAFGRSTIYGNMSLENIRQDWDQAMGEHPLARDPNADLPAVCLSYFLDRQIGNEYLNQVNGGHPPDDEEMRSLVFRLNEVVSDWKQFDEESSDSV